MVFRLLVVDGNVRAAREGHAAHYRGKTPGQAYADVLESLAAEVRCDVCLPADEGADLPDCGGLAGYDGVALTGSGLHIYHDDPAVARQVDFARAVFAANIPFFGSCWGLQVATVAAGGSVVRNPLGREAGIARNIAPNTTGRAHPLLAGRPAAFDAPCVHFDIVETLPPDATILAHNAYSAVQAAEIRHCGGTFWGVQYHPEYSLEQMAAILDRGWESFVAAGALPDQAGVHGYAAELRALHADRARTDIAWRLGIQPEIVDDHARNTELRNWILSRVRPEKSRRGRA